MTGSTYGTKQLVIVCIAQTSLLCSRYRRSQCRENDHIVGFLLEDVLKAFLHERHFVGKKTLKAQLSIQDAFGGTEEKAGESREASGKKERG